MCHRLFLSLLLSCATLAPVATKSALAVPQPDVPVLLKRVQQHFPAPDRQQQQVLRSLRLLVGNGETSNPDISQVRYWIQITPAKTPESRLKKMREELEIARRFTKWENIDGRRAGLTLALDAAKTARERGDMPLLTAIGAGFILPYLLDAPESGEESRFQILSALEEPFSVFELLTPEDQKLPLPDNETALDFHRLQIAIAPTPRDANWPRVRLARRLLRGNGTPTDRAAAFNNSAAREAFDALRALTPGEGALIFRYSMPFLATRIGEKLTPTELLDSSQTVRHRPWSNERPLTPEAIEALDALRVLCLHSPLDRADLIEEVARRCNFAPAEQAKLAAEADTSFDKLIDKYRRHLTSPGSYEFTPRSRDSLYRGYYVALRALNAALQQGDPKNIRQKLEALGNISYWSFDDVLLDDTLHWKFGDAGFNAEFNALHARIAETFVVDAVPFGDPNITFQNNVAVLAEGLPGTFLGVYPNSRGFRERRIQAEEQELRRAKEQKTPILFGYDPTQNDRMCALSRASCDLVARTATTENHYEQVIYAMARTLSAQDRPEDALLLLDLRWSQQKFTIDQQSLSAFLTSDFNKELQTRFATPTILRPLP